MMVDFRGKHNKEIVEKRIKNNLKNHLYNNKEYVIKNYNKINDLLEQKEIISIE